MKQNTDLRVQKTLKNLHEGFLSQIQEKPFSDIVVMDICKSALANRSTFYKYYADKYELRQQIVDDVLTEFYNELTLDFFAEERSQIDVIKARLDKSLQYIYSQKELYLLLWSPNLEVDVFGLMTETAKRKSINYFLEAENGARPDERFYGALELFGRIFASNTMATIKWWLQYAPQTERSLIVDIIMKSARRDTYNITYLL